MGRRWVGVVILVLAVGVAVAVAAVSRGDSRAPKRPVSPAASKQFGDDADLMRRFERKKLVPQSATNTRP